MDIPTNREGEYHLFPFLLPLSFKNVDKIELAILQKTVEKKFKDLKKTKIDEILGNFITIRWLDSGLNYLECCWYLFAGRLQAEARKLQEMLSSKLLSKQFILMTVKIAS